MPKTWLTCGESRRPGSTIDHGKPLLAVAQVDAAKAVNWPPNLAPDQVTAKLALTMARPCWE